MRNNGKVVLAAALLFGATAVDQANAKPIYFGTSVDAILGMCSEGEEMTTGFCLGFVYAIAYDLSEQKKSCAFGVMNFDSVVQLAVDALTKKKKAMGKVSQVESLNTQAWPVIKQAMIKEFPGPC